MPDKKFFLSGPEAVTLAGQTVDRLIRAGDGDAALLYLFMLKTHGQSSPEDAASAIGKSAGWVASAMAVLSRIGLITFDDNYGETQHSEPIEEPRRYTPDEIKREIETGSDFTALINEAQRSLGKILSPDELERLFGIYDALRLPVEVIMLLITHCITESRGRGGGRMPSMRYIEKAAYTWEREGIFSLDRAEEYLKSLEARKSAYGEIKIILQIRDRELSASEKRYVDGWIAMGFDPGAIEIAYDITILKTGKMVWGYMDSIMNNWHGKGIHTPSEISERNDKPAGNTERSSHKDSTQKFGAADRSEIEHLERVLQKIKED
jgi:DNA replication protein DnaD